MGKFESELHTLCEESKWPELCSILTSLLEHDPDLANAGSSDGSGDVHHRGRGGGSNHRLSRRSRERGVGGGTGGVGGGGGGGGGALYHQSNVESLYCRKQQHRRSRGQSQGRVSTAPTYATTNLSESDRNLFSASNHDANIGASNHDRLLIGESFHSEGVESFSEDLRCSYEHLDRDAMKEERQKAIDEYNPYLQSSGGNGHQRHDNTMLEEEGEAAEEEEAFRRRATTNTTAPLTEEHDASASSLNSSSGKASSMLSVDENNNNNNNNDTTQGGIRMTPERILSLKQQLISREGPNSWTPLMIACVRAPPIIMSLLIRACPEAASVPDRSGSLPLHLVCCWRRSKLLEDGVEGRDIEVPQSMIHGNDNSNDYGGGGRKGGRRRPRQFNGSLNNTNHSVDTQKNELCLVIYILMTSHPESLATTNRWKQTPIHSLFESKYMGRTGEMSHQSSLVETLLGMWGGHNDNYAGNISERSSRIHNNHNQHFVTNSSSHSRSSSRSSPLYKMFDSYIASTQQTNPQATPVNPNNARMLEAIRSAVQRALRARDSKGRLPLHCAAECAWTDERMLRTLAKAFPAAAWIPVLPPIRAAQSRSGTGSSSVTSFSWDVNRNAVLPKEAAAGKGDESRAAEGEGLFPKTGGCYGKDLAVHLLHRRFLSPVSGGLGASSHMGYKSMQGSSMHDQDIWSQSGMSDAEEASVFLNENHCRAISALLEPLVCAANESNNLEARLACAATGSGSNSNTSLHEADGSMYHQSSFYSAPSLTSTTLLPLHIATLHGVSHQILESLCRAYPEGAVTPMLTPLHYDRLNTLPIELFEEGRAGHEVNMASDDAQFLKLSVDYFRRSDLLFSYFPEAVSSKKVVYCRDEARLGRFECLIRREASLDTLSGADVFLSDMAGSVWLFLCRSTEPQQTKGGRKSRLPNFGAAIGRILSDLDPHSVHRLNFLRTTSIPEGVRVPPLSNGRSVLEEAKYRAPSGSMYRMLEEHFFHKSILSFLDARDALSYSSMCRRAWTRGVRLLPRISNNNSKMRTMDSEGSWKLNGEFCASETSSQEDERSGKVSEPWQKLELPYVPSCTHTVFISCDIAYHDTPSSGEADEHVSEVGGGGGGIVSHGTSVMADGGGLLILSEHTGTNAQSQPDLVIASIPVPSSGEEPPPDNDNDDDSQQSNRLTTHLKFSFNHLAETSYTLWYYGSERHTLTVTNLSVRQLVYSCDYNGHNPLHVLLCEGDNPSNLKEQLGALVAAGFGANLPIHYALKVGVSERTLRCLIEAKPSSLLDTDAERRTPLHAAFDSSKMPYLGIVQALLISPGMNATHLKDASGKLPIHIAAENGAGEAFLRVLVDAYVDGCYRRTDDGDLPLHLLVRSGQATQVTVELLLRPIIQNPTICAYTGSTGVQLPLHIAAEYRCKYSVFESLLSSFSEAANIQRQLVQPDPAKSEGGRPQPKKEAQYALEIFEEGRGTDILDMGPSSRSSNDSAGGKKRGSTRKALGEADFNLRSDLIFVHNPSVPKLSRPYLTTYYRDEKDRIVRLAAVIKREALQCSKKQRRNGTGGREEEGSPSAGELTEMAQLAWCWMCSNDHYAEVISDIVQALPIEAARFLALVENPKSEPVANTPIKDCSTPRCTIIIKSRLSFLGRYVFDRDSPPLHKSESCIILRTKDIGAMESYLSIQALLSDSDPDIDDYSHGAGSCFAITGNTIEIDRFTHFAQKIGMSQAEAITEVENLLLESPNASSSVMGSVMGSVFSGMDKPPNLKQSGVRKSVFREFCTLHEIDDTGCRSVAIKFMKSKQCFELERQCRDILRENGKSPPTPHHVVPILNHFSFEGSKSGDSNDFTKDIFGNGDPLLNLSALKFGIVMPCANGDLRDIFYREGISSSNLRENAKLVGQTLQALHEQGISHMSLQLKNVLQFGNRMVLSDFGSALFLKSIKGLNAIGGTSTKLSSSILPPEMVAKIDLSNSDSFDQLMRYWKYVHADANSLRALTPHERQAISQFVESLESKKYHKLANEKKKSDGQNKWKEDISSLLETIRFEDLPYVLSKCTAFNHFCSIWERMCQNHNLWETIIRPRVDDQKQCVYMLKTFENRPDNPPRDSSALPYKLVPPSEKVDVWIFGIFIYELCSGGNPFHTGYQGDLRGVDAYSRLHSWDKSSAEKNIREHVQDPLAQDLLCQILVPAEERLPSIAAVLKHPFFSPKSVEAERYLEKHEEMQILRDNTVSIRKVTKEVAQMLDESMEKYCKLAFATDQIAFPTCLVVLPYSLKFDESINRPIAPTNPRILSTAVTLGKCLLEINKATARLSFWLMMSGKMKGGDGIEFKSQMQDWLKRARYESCSSIAMEIVSGLGCGSNYAGICEEVLAYDGNISQAKAFMRDPIRAARRTIKCNSDELSALFQSISYLYLVDEITLIPSCPPRRSQGTLFPIQLEPNPRLISNVLLPFMNIVAMKALAKDKFEGLARLLGLSPAIGIPECWRSSEPGLIHSIGNTASIEDFVILQKILRKDDLNAFLDDASVTSRTQMSYHSGSATYDNTSYLSISALGLANIDLSPGDPAIAAIPMAQLELLFRERDPDREFGKLRRVTTGRASNTTLGLWTNSEIVRQLRGMVEIAELEEQLRELNLNLTKTKDAATQYASLMKRRKHLKRRMPYSDVSPLGERKLSFDNNSSDEHLENSNQENKESEDDIYSKSSISEDQPQTKRESPPKQRLEHHVPPPEQNQKLEISTHRMNQRQTASPSIDHHPSGPTPKIEADQAGAKKKMRKSKRRFRPWFTAC